MEGGTGRGTVHTVDEPDGGIDVRELVRVARRSSSSLRLSDAHPREVVATKKKIRKKDQTRHVSVVVAAKEFRGGGSGALGTHGTPSGASFSDVCQASPPPPLELGCEGHVFGHVSIVILDEQHRQERDEGGEEDVANE